MVRIAITRAVPPAALEQLGELPGAELRVGPNDQALRRDELLDLVRGAAAIVSLPGDRIDDELLDAAGGQLRIVANYAVGYENIDVEACRRRGVVATNTPHTLAETTADLAWALILAAPRRVAEGDRHIRAGRPWRLSWDFMLGRDVWGSTLGIVGLGAIGRAVARRARGFDMEVLYTQRRQAPPDVEAALGARRVELTELLARSDVVTLHCPHTPETHHLIDAEALRAMKRTAYIVNTARGPIVDEAALVAALEAGEIAGAGLDVFEHEPDVHPGLLPRDDVVLVPHLGSATEATRERMGLRAAANVVAVLEGRDAPDAL